MVFNIWRTKHMSMPNVKSSLMKAVGIVLFLAMVLPFSTAAGTEASYPTKPVRLIITFAPGGGNDIVGRLVATRLSQRLGQQVVPENRPGAGGVLGTDYVAKSDPDGYTILFISSSYVTSNLLYKIPYDPEKAFIPIAFLGSSKYLIAVNSKLPVDSVKELIALAKKQPGNLACAISGVGTGQHLASELFKSMTGIDIMMVAFKGLGPALVDVAGGHSHLTVSVIASAMPFITSGKLRPLAIAASKRRETLPNVPTTAEAGVPGYETCNWYGLLAPTGTPKAIVDRLNKELATILNSAEVKNLFEKQGIDAEYLGVSEFGKLMATEMVQFKRIIKEANIKAVEE